MDGPLVPPRKRKRVHKSQRDPRRLYDPKLQYLQTSAKSLLKQKVHDIERADRQIELSNSKERPRSPVLKRRISEASGYFSVRLKRPKLHIPLAKENFDEFKSF